MRKPYKVINERERLEWVKTLKKGQRVINIIDFKGDYPIYEELQVKSISKKRGNITLTNGLILNSKGVYIDEHEGAKALPESIEKDNVYVCIIMPYPEVWE